MTVDVNALTATHEFQRGSGARKLAGVTTLVADAGVAKVRVVLAGGFTGIATFDRVRLWEE